MPTLTFEAADGRVLARIDAPAGKSVLEIAQANDIDMEGACESSMACSTCHVIVDPRFYGRLPPPSEEERDMLDLTAHIHPTSRLGCQLVLTDDLDGLCVRLPPETHNLLGL